MPAGQILHTQSLSAGVGKCSGFQGWAFSGFKRCSIRNRLVLRSARINACLEELVAPAHACS